MYEILHETLSLNEINIFNLKLNCYLIYFLVIFKMNEYETMDIKL